MTGDGRDRAIRSVVGIGAGNPDHVTMQAIARLGRTRHGAHPGQGRREGLARSERPTSDGSQARSVRRDTIARAREEKDRIVDRLFTPIALHSRWQTRVAPPYSDCEVLDKENGWLDE